MTLGYVYRLVCSDVNVKEIYVGSTKSLRNRRTKHKTACNNPAGKSHHLPVYQHIRENGGWGNWVMVVIETMDYNEKHELRARERYWIETLNAQLNVKIPTRTTQEWREDNKDHVLEVAHQYHRNHAESRNQQNKAYRQANAEAIGQYDRERSVQRELTMQLVVCECGAQIRRDTLIRHRKTVKHQQFISAQTIATPNIAPVPTNGNNEPGAASI